jgi:hypothetical protein
MEEECILLLLLLLLMMMMMMMMMMMIMSMGWDYISELRPPTGLLFILQVIPEHGEPWWNDIDRGNYRPIVSNLRINE